jgi:2-keto-4-pentenoate hydratase
VGSGLDSRAIAQELFVARASGQTVDVPPSARDAAFDLSAAYEVEAELVRLRHAHGHSPVGRKVGYANKAVWRVLKLETLVWAHMYDDTVRHTAANDASLSVANLRSPKIEPEIVFKLREPLPTGMLEAVDVLDAVDWLALGFEIIDCPFPDWKFQPTDFVANFGLHAALIVGDPMPIVSDRLSALAGALAGFTVSLSKNGQPVAEGSGRNVLRSPVLCLGVLGANLSRSADPLRAGELVSSGTLTEPQPIAPGETWTATLEGLPLRPLTLQTT